MLEKINGGKSMKDEARRKWEKDRERLQMATDAVLRVAREHGIPANDYEGQYKYCRKEVEELWTLMFELGIIKVKFQNISPTE
jgi:hypothetical protein